jgi:hypothetical protein
MHLLSHTNYGPGYVMRIHDVTTQFVVDGIGYRPWLLVDTIP